jgi:hypothetical protein
MTWKARLLSTLALAGLLFTSLLLTTPPSGALTTTTTTTPPDVPTMAAAFAKTNNLVGTVTCTSEPKAGTLYVCWVPLEPGITTNLVSWVCDVKECFPAPGATPFPVPESTIPVK